MAARKKAGGFIVLVILVIGIFSLWRLFGPNTNFEDKRKAFYVSTGSSFEKVMKDLDSQHILKNPGTFKLVAKQLDYNKKVKAGRYLIENGASIFDVVRLLRSGRQSPVNLVINKLRTREDLARLIDKNFECDSSEVMALLDNNDSLKTYSLDTNNVMTAIIPNTYSFLWNTTPNKIFKKLYNEQEIFWNKERMQKAGQLGLSMQQVYILASIVEEETNKQEDKGKIASVYINRLKTGMRLAADPTVKFAMRDFGLKRIYHKHLLFPSPYNTYQNAGLPPGPICTPAPKTIDAVLDSPGTDYLFFVAKPDLNGYSNFATNYTDHLKYAKAYQSALDDIIKRRANKDSMQ